MIKDYYNYNNTTLDGLVQLRKQLCCQKVKRAEPQERHLKTLLEKGQLTEAIHFLETKGIRRESALKIFSRLSHNSEDREVAA